jgi:hypothetical protein
MMISLSIGLAYLIGRTRQARCQDCHPQSGCRCQQHDKEGVKKRQKTTQPGAHTLKPHCVASARHHSSHANAQALSIELRASAEHNTGSGRAGVKWEGKRGGKTRADVGKLEHEKKLPPG